MNANAKIGFASKGSMMRWDFCNSADWSAAQCVWRWSHPINLVLLNKIVCLSTNISDNECLEHDECLQCLEQNDFTKDCQVPENVSQVFDKVHQREGTEEGGCLRDKESSFIGGLLEIKVFYLMCLPVMLWMKVIRFTLFLCSFLLLDNWMKQLVEPLTTFLLGNNLVSRGV